MGYFLNVKYILIKLFIYHNFLLCLGFGRRVSGPGLRYCAISDERSCKWDGGCEVVFCWTEDIWD